MTEPYIGEIRIFSFGFAPRDWATCSGQLLSISQNQALFALLGTIYGGDGQSTFGLPDLRSRIPIHAGSGPGLSNHTQGERGGLHSHTLTSTQIPSHRHAPQAGGAADQTSAAGGVFAESSDANFGSAVATDTSIAVNGTLDASAVANAGGNQTHANQPPYLGLNICIALFGIFPSR